MSDNPEQSVWHEGERAVQRRAGVPDAIERVGHVAIRPFMPDQHRQFFAQLPFLVVGSVDEERRPWASMLFGQPGFVASPDPTHLTIAARPLRGDPLGGALKPGAPLATLGIELPTRRRNRANGTVTALDADGFVLTVEESFGNCPQYIQRRSYGEVRAASVEAEPLAGLDAEAIETIRTADTMFVASAAARVDVSHRGGRPGFLAVAPDGAILVPDYSGNRFFNTLGNFTVNPRGGLLIPDFDKGDLLQLTGTTEILWDGPELARIDGAERMWRFHPAAGVRRHNALPTEFRFEDYSPRSLMTGVWRAA